MELEGLLSAFFTVSKRRWGPGLALESLAVFAGAVSVILEFAPTWAGVATAATALVGSLLRWRADVLRSYAEELLRAKELRDGLGWPVDRKRYADLRADHSSLAKLANFRQEEQSNFYETDEPVGPRRLVQMLRESTWWSERLARFCFWLTLGLVILLVIVSLYAFPFAESFTGVPLEADQLVSLYTSLICLVFSGNVARLIFGYNSLSTAARDAYERLDSLADQSDLSGATALSIVMTYQFVRSAAPPIPDWVWRLRRTALNEAWEEELSHRS